MKILRICFANLLCYEYGNSSEIRKHGHVSSEATNRQMKSLKDFERSILATRLAILQHTGDFLGPVPKYNDTPREYRNHMPHPNTVTK